MGRSRDARADRAILETTFELIAERWVHAFRTRSSKRPAADTPEQA